MSVPSNLIDLHPDRPHAGLSAHEQIGDAVEDSAMVTANGGQVVVVPGEPTNVHVTTPAELAVAQALLPLLASNETVLVAPSTGAMLLHAPINRYVFNVRSSYQREAEKAVENSLSLGVQRLALVYLDDSFGEDGREGALKAFKKNNLQPVVEIRIDRVKPDVKAIAAQLIKSNAQSSLWIGPSNTVAGGVQALRAADSKMQVITLSNNASSGFVQALGPQAQGVVVARVFPGVRATNYLFVKEATELARAKGLTEISPSTLEGFAAAKVLVEALRHAAPGVTQAKMVAALEGISKFDLGGLMVSFSPTDHSGLDYADVSIIGADGKFKR